MRPVAVKRSSQIAPPQPGVYYADSRRLPIAPPKSVGFVFYDSKGNEMGACWVRGEFDVPATLEEAWSWWDRMNHADETIDALRPSSARVLRLHGAGQTDAGPDRQGGVR